MWVVGDADSFRGVAGLLGQARGPPHEVRGSSCIRTHLRAGKRSDDSTQASVHDAHRNRGRALPVLQRRDAGGDRRSVLEALPGPACARSCRVRGPERGRRRERRCACRDEPQSVSISPTARPREYPTAHLGAGPRSGLRPDQRYLGQHDVFCRYGRTSQGPAGGLRRRAHAPAVAGRHRLLARGGCAHRHLPAQQRRHARAGRGLAARPGPHLARLHGGARRYGCGSRVFQRADARRHGWCAQGLRRGGLWA